MPYRPSLVLLGALTLLAGCTPRPAPEAEAQQVQAGTELLAEAVGRLCAEGKRSFAIGGDLVDEEVEVGSAREGWRAELEDLVRQVGAEVSELEGGVLLVSREVRVTMSSGADNNRSTVLQLLAGYVGFNILVGPDLPPRMPKLAVREALVSEALRAAGGPGSEFRHEGALLLVTTQKLSWGKPGIPRRPPLPPRFVSKSVKRISLEARDTPLRDLVALLAKRAQQQIGVGEDLEASELTLRLADVAWPLALRIVAGLAHCEIAEGEGGRLVLQESGRPGNQVQVSGSELGPWCRLLERAGGLQIQVPEDLEGRRLFPMDLTEVSAREALAATGVLNGFRVEEAGGSLKLVGRVQLSRHVGRESAEPAPPEPPPSAAALSESLLAVLREVEEEGSWGAESLPPSATDRLGGVLARLGSEGYVKARKLLQARREELSREVLAQMETGLLILEGDGVLLAMARSLELEDWEGTAAAFEVARGLHACFAKRGPAGKAHAEALFKRAQQLAVEGAFQASLPVIRVEAILLEEETQWAVVNGRVCKKGNILEGHNSSIKVVEILKSRVRLRRGDAEWVRGLEYPR